MELRDLGLVFLAGCFVAGVKIYDWMVLIKDVQLIYANPVIAQGHEDWMEGWDLSGDYRAIKWTDHTGRQFSMPLFGAYQTWVDSVLTGQSSALPRVEFLALV